MKGSLDVIVVDNVSDIWQATFDPWPLTVYFWAVLQTALALIDLQIRQLFPKNLHNTFIQNQKKGTWRDLLGGFGSG